MNKSTLKIIFLIVLLLTILPLALFILVQFMPPRETSTSGGPSASESSDKTATRERHAGRVEARTVRHEYREEDTAIVEYDMTPNPGLTEGELADRRNGIVGAINPNGRGKQATPYRPDEVPGDSGVMVQYAGSPDDMIGAPPPPQENDLWGGRPAMPIPPENMRGIGGVRRIDPNDPFFQQDIPNPFANR